MPRSLSSCLLPPAKFILFFLFFGIFLPFLDIYELALSHLHACACACPCKCGCACQCLLSLPLSLSATLSHSHSRLRSVGASKRLRSAALSMRVCLSRALIVAPSHSHWPPLAVAISVVLLGSNGWRVGAERGEERLCLFYASTLSSSLSPTAAAGFMFLFLHSYNKNNKNNKKKNS